jgi:hypothetical protein
MDWGLFWAISRIEFVIFSTLKSSMARLAGVLFHSLLSCRGLLSLLSAHFIRSTV